MLASDALVPSGVAQTPALWMQDNADDTGIEPDPSTRPMWISDDIWVRNGPDGLSVQDHQNPLADQTNFVYVRVRNRGCRMTAAQSGELRLYWAKASSSLSWPAPWDGSVTSPALMGGMIGSQDVTVAGGSQAILTFEWTPPDPSDFASFGADKAHFCLLARIETSSTPPYGMTSPETSNLYANVQNNNKIIWKNITIVDMDGDGGRFASVVVGALGHKQQALHLVFDAAAPRPKLASLFEWVHVIVELAGALAHWGKDCDRRKGVEQLADGRLVVTRSGAELQGPPLKKGEFGALQLRFVPDARHVIGTHILELDVAELDSKRNRLGGQRVLLRTADGREPVKWDTQLGTFDGIVIKPLGIGFPTGFSQCHHANVERQCC
ncbi:Type-1 glutamine synthetase 2 [Fusarium oxysporum f. sp. albedinis]|nr:Type-1 glutamine synthetase 2 [Fusarium oxysporum f. sp. albedinis]